MNSPFNELRTFNDPSREIGMYLEGSAFFPFLQRGFSFATLQASGKIPRDIDKLLISEIGLDKTSVQGTWAFSRKRFCQT